MRFLLNGLFFTLVSFLPFALSADSGHGHTSTSSFVERLFLYDPVTVVTLAGIIIFLATLVALANKNHVDSIKKLLFLIISVASVGATLYVLSFTIYKDVTSVTKGAVHWHADFRVFNCGEEVSLVDPQGLLNRVGTPVLHEHGDGRIHVEGRVDAFADISLENFFAVVGGEFTDDALTFPTNDGMVTLQDGAHCPSGQPASLQTFVYTTEDGVVQQTKLEHAPDYVISSHGSIPPGDCLIFELSDTEREHTDMMCPFYQIEIEKGNFIYNQ